MKRTFSRIAIIVCLLFAQMPYGYGQDTRKEKPRKETSNDDMESESESDMPEEEGASVRKTRTKQSVGLGLETGVGVNVMQMGSRKSGINAAGTLGAYADIRMAGRFYIQPGLFYVLNGGSNVVISGVSPYGLDLRITTLEIPVTIAYKTGMPDAKVRFTIGAGGYIGYIPGANINGVTLKIGDNKNDEIRAMEVGLGLNVGLELRNGLFFRIKSQRGLTDLQPDPTGPAMYTESDVITIGYMIRKHAKHYRRRAGNGDDYVERRM